jgi:hypothetical protein
MTFLKYELKSSALCMGERTKGGLFRPCCRTIRYSQISGALRAHFGGEWHAAGHLVESEGHNTVQYFTYSPRAKAQGVSKIPLTVEFLTDVLGLVYVVPNRRKLPKEFEITMGALRSQGLGRCTLTYQGKVESQVAQGHLNTRIPLDVSNVFGVVAMKPVYGYLFRPLSQASGEYVLSLFEGSLVEGPDVLLKEGTHG